MFTISKHVRVSLGGVSHFWTSLSVSSLHNMKNLFLYHEGTSLLLCFRKLDPHHLVPLRGPSITHPPLRSPSIPNKIIEINMSR